MPGDFWNKIRVLFNEGQQPRQVAPSPYAPSQQPVSTQPLAPQSGPLSVAEKEGIIHEAGRRRVLLDIKYDGVSRLVEPYSFRMRQIGGRQFYGFCLLHGGIHSFKVEKMEEVKLTDWPYSPRWEIEL